MEIKCKNLIRGDQAREQKKSIDRFPDTCPICHTSINPMELLGLINTMNNTLEVPFMCTKYECQKLFIGYYRTPPQGTSIYSFWKVTPIKTVQKKFDKEIEDISLEFPLIYNQAKEAEERDLNHIAGMGYRKALEFLIKDYLIIFKEQNKEEIENKFLGRCINEDVQDENIKDVASRTAWLGNDETHYKRRWANKDINDLKTLIKLTLYWVSSEIKTQKLLSEMSKN